MSSGTQPTEPIHGYLSEESKRRFTLMAGILGAVFFVAQIVLPMVMMFAIMVPMMFGSEMKSADLARAVFWRGEVWFVEGTTRLGLRDPSQSTTRSLEHVRPTDLSQGGGSFALAEAAEGSNPSLLAAGERLWVIGSSSVSYVEEGVLTRLSAGTQPARASTPFLYKERPAVVSLGSPTSLFTLGIEAGRAIWMPGELPPLGLPAEAGALRGLQGLEAGGHTYLVAELCTETPDHCSLRYRKLEADRWLSLVEDACSCASWTAVAVGSSPAVVVSEREGGTVPQLSVVTVTPAGPRRERIEARTVGPMSSYRHAVSEGSRLLLLFDGMPGSLKLLEVADGSVVRTVKRSGSFPFWSGNMMLMMGLPQLLPIVLSLVLAFLLSAQMRRHRVQEYAIEGRRRTFASLGQRALAQLVDLVPLLVAFVPGYLWMSRMFSDPESLFESGPAFPLRFFGLFAAALLWGALVFVGYSYLEGRFGKTPGKWLLGICVLGTDLRPCGFGRALLRNLLTFADGFFNFLVGALLVALTENWQRLGDLAARTVVVVDEKAA